MNNDGSFRSPAGNGAPGQNRSFGPDMAREAEGVPRRMAGESLDDYLRNINSYLNDLNSRLGTLERNAGLPPQDVSFAAPPETAAPAAEVPSDGAAFAEPADPGPGPENAGADPDASVVPPQGSAPDLDGGAPYGIDFDGARYSESVAPEGYARSDWQAAVPHPELYPDLDDLADAGARGRKKEKQRRRKEARPPKMTRGGKSRFSFVTTVFNLALYGGWTVLYFVCLTVRSMMFTGAQAEMASQGVTAYSVTISSPLFTALKILIYAMPVVLLLWIRGVLSAEKKQLPQLDKKLLIAAFAADLLAGIVVIFDVLAARLIFG